MAMTNDQILIPAVYQYNRDGPFPVGIMREECRTRKPQKAIVNIGFVERHAIAIDTLSYVTP
jgi:hypothetical protein